MSIVSEKTFVMPSAPHDRAEIIKVMGEISGAMTRIEGEKDYIKNAVSDLNQKFQISKKLLNRFAKTYHKQSYADELGSDSEFETMVEILVNPNKDQ